MICHFKPCASCQKSFHSQDFTREGYTFQIWCNSFLWHISLFSASAEFGWPSGTYGLPEPASGCPSFGEVTWKRGYTYHNTEDEYPSNKRSQNYHFAGNFSQHGIQQRFCIKDNPVGRKEGWPDGKYCIYKKGQLL